MIPKAYIDAWRSTAPWQQDAQVEQDLVISRTIVEMFSNEFLSEHLAFRGGTALHKLFLTPQARYSEDIDLVQIKEGPIKPVLESIADQLQFLGDKDSRDIRRRNHNWVIYYRFDTEVSPPPRMRVKIEINTREHFHIMKLNKETFSVDNPWYTETAELTTYEPEELLGTKLRALYQRKKGRDLFDLYYALMHIKLDIDKVIHCFRGYIEQEENKPPTRREFELNLMEKMKDSEFTGDITGLLRPDVVYDQNEALDAVFSNFFQKM